MAMTPHSSRSLSESVASGRLSVVSCIGPPDRSLKSIRGCPGLAYFETWGTRHYATLPSSSAALPVPAALLFLHARRAAALLPIRFSAQTRLRRRPPCHPPRSPIYRRWYYQSVRLKL